MDEHKKLVMAERDELEKKINTLYDFLGTVPYRALPEREQYLLAEQYSAMRSCGSIIEERIAEFETQEEIMTKYRKKQEVIDAIRWTGENRQQLLAFTGRKNLCFLMDMSVTIQAIDGNITADMGDWIIKDTDGKFSRRKNELFEMTHEPA